MLHQPVIPMVVFHDGALSLRIDRASTTGVYHHAQRRKWVGGETYLVSVQGAACAEAGGGLQWRTVPAEACPTAPQPAAGHGDSEWRGAHRRLQWQAAVRRFEASSTSHTQDHGDQSAGVGK